MNLLIFGVQKKSYLLQVIFMLVTISIGHCMKLEAIINVYMETTYSNYLQASFYDTNYNQLQRFLVDNKTKSVNLNYVYGYENHWTQFISRIDGQTYNHNQMNAYFRCYFVPRNELIMCSRTIRCNSAHLCPNGFGIFWLYPGEYLVSEHLQNNTVQCTDVGTLTCYKLLNTPAPTRTVRTTHRTTTSTTKVNTVKTTTKLYYYVSTTKLVSTTKNTVGRRNSSFATTIFLTNNSTKTTPSDSTALIAGVIVGNVIIGIIVCVVIFLYTKRQVKSQPGSSGQLHQSGIHLTERPFDGSGYKHNYKSTGSTITNSEQYAVYSIANTNNYTNIEMCSSARNNQHQPHQASDYAGIEEDHVAQLHKVLTLDKENKEYYNTICDNQENIDLRQVNAEDGYSTIEGSSSVLSVLHLVSPQTDYSTVNKHVGSNNFKEILENKNHIDLHEYNNIKQENATTERNEPVKNVYSKLGDNNRNFEHPYGNVGVSKHTGEENSSKQPDIVYFILENEENIN